MDLVIVVKELQNRYGGKKPSNRSDARKMAKDAANACLECIGGYPVPIGDALRKLNFKVWVKDFTKRSVSGVMALNANRDYPKVIGVNKEDSKEHQAFTLAHELGHYIFDIKNEGQEIVRVHYDTEADDGENLEEYRANKFATYLLMPENIFRAIVRNMLRSGYKEYDIKDFLHYIFGVSVTAINKRMDELRIVL